MAVNTRGPFECVKAALPVMRRQGYGKIINIASGTVFKGTPMMLHYVSSKGAVVAMTRAMARELGEHGICCNALAPGLTLSDTIKGRNDYGARRTLNVESRSLKREETPDDLVGALLFLASHDSDFMTGQTLWSMAAQRCIDPPIPGERDRLGCPPLHQASLGSGARRNRRSDDRRAQQIVAERLDPARLLGHFGS